MVKTNLADIYRGYIACLNTQDWPKLAQFVHDEVSYNGQRIGLSGYREMLERDFDEIPDLYFDIQLLISDPPYIASRLGFNCTPKGKFLGLHVNGKRISFTENVFDEFRSEKIERVWSVIDRRLSKLSFRAKNYRVSRLQARLLITRRTHQHDVSEEAFGEGVDD
jgi:predicted ester cyclase